MWGAQSGSILENPFFAAKDELFLNLRTIFMFRIFPLKGQGFGTFYTSLVVSLWLLRVDAFLGNVRAYVNRLLLCLITGSQTHWKVLPDKLSLINTCFFNVPFVPSFMEAKVNYLSFLR